ncbi:MAG: hypothetical protein KAR17_18855, partial [Cyclobacteriaceae bacterium]|nr:hypothetical protein [Cyclobacteriaceae bacterium]
METILDQLGFATLLFITVLLVLFNIHRKVPGCRYIHIIIIVWISCIFQSCDPSNFTLPAYQADIYVPVLDIELNVGDLILADTADILQE